MPAGVIVLIVLALARMASAATMETQLPNTNLGSSRVGVASTTTRTLTVRNVAAATSDLTFTAASSTSDFVLSTTAGTLSPGASVAITVTFTPSGRGATNAMITVSGNDTANPSDSFMVNGTGISPNMVVSWTGAPNPLDFATAAVTAGTTTRTITISNPPPGNAPLVFSVDVTAGTADYAETDPSSPTLAVGDSVAVTITFDPSVVRTRTGTASITGDDALNPADTVSLTGVGQQAVLTPSAASLSFGTVDVGLFEERPLTITNDGNLSAQVTSISSGNAAYSFVVTGAPLPRLLAPTESLALTVRFTPVDGSIVMANLSIATTGSPATITVPMTGDGLYEDVGIAVIGEPDLMLDLGNSRVGVAATRSVTVTNVGEAPATVSLPTSSSTACVVDAVTPTVLPAVLAPAASATFLLRVTPAAVGIGACTITVSTTIPTTDTITVDYFGTAPDVTLTLPVTGAINFGVVDVDGGDEVRTVVLDNDGTAPLKIGPCTITGSAKFSVTTSCANLSVAPGASATLTIAFDPMVEASESAQLAIAVDALDTSLVTVSLSGVGADQRIDLSALSVSFPTTSIVAVDPPIEYVDVFNPTNPATGVAETLHISMATTDDSVFRLANQGPFTVEPGAMIRLAVTFEPDVARAYSGLLVVSSDASATPMAMVSLSGRGIDVVETGGCCDSGRASDAPLTALLVAFVCRRRRRAAPRAPGN